MFECKCISQTFPSYHFWYLYWILCSTTIVNEILFQGGQIYELPVLFFTSLIKMSKQYLFCRQILDWFPKEVLRRSHTPSPVTQRHWTSTPFLQICTWGLVFITSLFQRPDFSVENIMVWDVNKVQITTSQIYIYIHPTCTLQNVRTCSFKHFLNPRGKNALNTHLVFF